MYIYEIFSTRPMTKMKINQNCQAPLMSKMFYFIQNKLHYKSKIFREYYKYIKTKSQERA